jgi:hypothetical protein
MATGSIGQQVTVSSVSFTVDVSTRVNVHKRRERVAYRTLSNEDNINIEYLIGEASTPDNNLFISDRSTSLVQNRDPVTTVKVDTTGGLTLNVEKFLITDIFTTDSPTAPTVPLFYVHTLKNFNEGVDGFANKTLLSIEFADYTLNPISFTEYTLISSTGKLYNNIENIYDDSSGVIDVKYIKYTVRTSDSTGISVDIFHELINNETVFKIADWEDIDEWGHIIAGKKRYIVSQAPGGATYQVTLPQSAKYGWKELPSSRIRVLPPVAADTKLPWNVRITNGDFLTSLRKTVSSYANYRYYVAEYTSQTYDPYPPYKFQGKQTGTWIGDTLIKVPKNVSYSEGSILHVELIIKDNTHTVKFAYSTDANKIGTEYTDSGIYYTSGILSVDSLNGFIEVADVLRSDYEIYAYYYTEEDQYEFTAVNFNPVTNLDILNERVVIYTIPESTYTGELDSSIFFLKVDPVGKITYCSQVTETLGSLESSVQKLVSEDFNEAGVPSHDFYYDKTSTVSGLLSRASGVNSSYIDDLSFVDKYTVESSLFTSQSGLLSEYAAQQNLADNPHFLVLANVYVGPSQSPNSFTKFDVRVQGGGIKSANEADAFDEQAEASFYADMNAARPVPGVGAFMVEVPQTLTIDHGGTYTTAQIKDVVKRHMSMGSYPIVNTYGLDPYITSATGGIGRFTIGWPSYVEEENITYNVYFSDVSDRDFVLASGSPYADTSPSNSVTLSGLSTQKKYYTYIETIDSTGDTSLSQTVSVTTTKE